MTGRAQFVLLCLVAGLWGGSGSQTAEGQALLQQQVQVQASSSSELLISGLRFSGGRVSVLSLPQLPSSLSDLASSAAQQLDYEQAYDTGAKTWRISVPARAAHVSVWCQACLAGATARVTQQLAHVDLPQPAALGGGTVLVLLTGAVVPTAALQQVAGTVQQAEQQLGTARRRLQQSGTQSLTIGGQSYSFDNVDDLSSSVQDLSSLKLYYTLYSNGTLRGALVGAPPNSASSSYIGLGINGRGMLGTNVVAVTPDFTDGYRFTSTSQSRANAARGQWHLTDTSSGTSNGALAGTFTATGIKSGSQPCVWAYGAYSNGMLQDHQETGWEGYCTLNLQVSPDSSSSGSSSGSSSSAPATPASPPSTETPSPSAPAPESESGGASQDASTSSPSSSGSSSGTTLATTTTAASSDGSGSGSGCVLTSNGQTSTYNACMRVTGIGQNFFVMWNVTPKADDPSTSVLSMALNTTDTSGYVAVAWPSEPSTMTGASAMILIGGSSPAMVQYYLGGTDQSQVNQGGGLPASNMTAANGGGWLTGSFQLEGIPTPSGSNSSGRRLLRRLLQSYLNTPANQNLLYAAGPVGSGNTPLEHIDYGDSNVNLLAGADGSGGGLQSDGSINAHTAGESLYIAHAWMATIGWGVLIPLGVVGARAKTLRPPFWFHFHRAIQTIGFLIGTVGIGLGFAYTGGWGTEYTVHRDLGVTVLVLGIVQLTALVFRPQPNTKYRPAWAFVHHWIGRSATAIAIANIFYALTKVKDIGWAVGAYAGVLGAIVLLGVVNEAAVCLDTRRSKSSKAASGHEQFMANSNVFYANATSGFAANGLLVPSASHRYADSSADRSEAGSSEQAKRGSNEAGIMDTAHN